jgi:NAD(P)-dependent dehydrogenase (short-subunit alcohol dehydrogenase family)
VSSASSTSRRTVLTSAALGAAGLAAGAASAATVIGSKKGHEVTVDGRARFKNKVVLITGATSGIGAAAAKMFAAEGGKVAFCGRRTERGAQVENAIKAQGGEAKYIHADVRVEDDVRRFVDTAAQRYGGLDVCFNNAGITIEHTLHEYTSAEWDDVINTDLRGNFLAAPIAPRSAAWSRWSRRRRRITPTIISASTPSFQARQTPNWYGEQPA